MKLLTFADLHLGDYKSSPKYDEYKLDNIMKLTSEIKPDFLINLGDTVTKNEKLRDPAEKMTYWKQYTEFRNSLDCQILETCLGREREFFSDLFETECEFSLVKDDVVFISFDPIEDGDHHMLPDQIEWLTYEIKKHSGKKMIYMSHVPVAQTSVHREVGPCIYLTESELIKELAAMHGQFAVFLGGHFHAPPEDPVKENNLLMLMAGCFLSGAEESSKKRNTYLRIIDISKKNITIRTIDDSNREIVPIFRVNIK